MSSTSISVYTGRSTNWPMLWLSTVLAVPLVGLAVAGGGSWTSASILVPLAIVLAALVFNLLTATSVRTTAGPQGVTVRFGVLAWPRFHFPAERIAHAEAIDLPFSLWFGWGIWWTPSHGLMLTLNQGPALRLTLTNGRRVVISTPEPGKASAALRTSAARPQRGEGLTRTERGV